MLGSRGKGTVYIHPIPTERTSSFFSGGGKRFCPGHHHAHRVRLDAAPARMAALRGVEGVLDDGRHACAPAAGTSRSSGRRESGQGSGIRVPELRQLRDQQLAGASCADTARCDCPRISLCLGRLFRLSSLLSGLEVERCVRVDRSSTLLALRDIGGQRPGGHGACTPWQMACHSRIQLPLSICMHLNSQRAGALRPAQFFQKKN